MRGVQLRAGAVVTSILALCMVAPPAAAASILYGDSPNIPPGVTFEDVTESSGTDAVPLYGPPDYFTTGIDFDPAGFVSTASGGASDVTDGQLNFAVRDTPGGPPVAIDSIRLFEAGDYTLTGTGTTPTQAIAGAIIRVTVTEIDGVPVAPVVLTPSSASVGFNLLANPGVVQPWSLGTSIDIDGQIGPHTIGATAVEVAIDDQLATTSQPGSLAFIAKKEFIVEVGTTVIPEPAGLVFAVVLAGAMVRRSARFRGCRSGSGLTRGRCAAVSSRGER